MTTSSNPLCSVPDCNTPADYQVYLQIDYDAWQRMPGANYLDDYPSEVRPRKRPEVICSWYIDNPMGSTFCELSLSRRDGWLAIDFRVDHDELPESWRFADLPDDVVKDADTLFNILLALFARNGADEHGTYLLKCSPHAVCTGTVVPEERVKALFLSSREITDDYEDGEAWWQSVHRGQATE